MRRAPRVPAHVALEIYSVLTRLPAPHRAEPEIVHDFLAQQFPDPFLTLSAKGHRNVLDRLASLDVGGGAVYDAVVAATARESKLTLVSRDRRALPIYELMDVDLEMLG